MVNLCNNTTLVSLQYNVSEATCMKIVILASTVILPFFLSGTQGRPSCLDQEAGQFVWHELHRIVYHPPQSNLRKKTREKIKYSVSINV